MKKTCFVVVLVLAAVCSECLALPRTVSRTVARETTATACCTQVTKTVTTVVKTRAPSSRCACGCSKKPCRCRNACCDKTSPPVLVPIPVN